MSRIRGKNTTPEMRVRSLLHQMGYRFRLHVRIPVPSPPLGEKVPEGRMRGSPRPSLPSPLTPHPSLPGIRRTPRAVSVDILLPKYKTAIFVHGCFWHRHQGCKNCTTPTNRREGHHAFNAVACASLSR
jgi:DNA mismatch endonuclease, patch repair protein